LIQSLATENNTFITKETVLQRDDTYWNETIVPKLTEFVRAFYVFVNDPLLQDRFLQTSDNRKSVLLNSFIKSATKQTVASNTQTTESKKTNRGNKRSSKKGMESDAQPSKKQKTTPTGSHLITSAINVSDVCKDDILPVVNELVNVSHDPIDAMDALMDSTIAIKNIKPIKTVKSTNSSSMNNISDIAKPAPIVACFFETPELSISAVDCSVPLYKLVPDTWASVLDSQFNLEYFKQLTSFVDQDYKTFIVYPPRPKIFTALEKCPFEQVKVVILGQDPYIHTGEAMGMSFSVPKGVKFPRSLKNIYEELKSDVNVTPTTGDLTAWANQGVLLLNTVLTVRDSKSDSHAGKGWEQFTNHIIRQISEQRPHVVFLLWGGKAQSKKPLINTSKHTILETSHPSPLSYTRGFQGCKHFSKANEALKQHGQTPIDWNVSL
jgi:uracil-DNA glycosylase